MPYKSLDRVGRDALYAIAPKLSVIVGYSLLLIYPDISAHGSTQLSPVLNIISDSFISIAGFSNSRSHAL